VREIFAALEARAIGMIRRARMPTEPLRVARSIEARYLGQNFELTVPAVLEDGSDEFAIDALRTAFDVSHRRFYGYDLPEKPVELVTFRLRAALPGPEVDLARQSFAPRSSPLRPTAHRRVLFNAAQDGVNCPVFDRSDFRPGDAFQGPAIVEQMDTTTVVPADFSAVVDSIGNLLLSGE
jgi:N-methylhydantoinase A